MKPRFFVATLLMVAAAAVTALANVNGAIYTSVADGTVVNRNIYQDKNEVYLNGGPQNESSAGLSPDGLYYFQITDPSGAVLLSEDPIECRVLVVAGGRIAGAAPASACRHNDGVFNAANGTLPVQMMPFADTPNPGGEYKAWITPVGSYDAARCDDGRRQGAHGFCDAESKTDNFKVRSSAPDASYVTVCKFNDVDGDGVKADGEPFIPHWPVAASGIDAGAIESQTGDDGCATFTVSGFNGAASKTIVLSEGTFGPDWTQTAPGTGTITLEVTPGQEIDAPNFGNHNPFCGADCTGTTAVVTAQALPSLSRTYAWDISKTADQAVVKTSSTETIVNYTVTLTHDAGTDSDWAVTGDITVANPTSQALVTELIVDAAGAACSVAGGNTVTVAAGSHDVLAYSCVFPAAPGAGTIAITATSNLPSAGTAPAFDFAGAAVNVLEGQATVDDTLAGTLGTASAADAGPFVFSYSKTLPGTPGECVTTNNTATFTTAATTGSSSQPVQVCVGASLQVAKTAGTSFSTSITKSAERTLIQQQGGPAALNYTVRVTESGWAVSGVITVTNPNTWQAVAADVMGLIDNGGACTITGGTSVTVPSSSSVELPYTCTYAVAPLATGTNTVSVAWDGSAAFTPATLATASAPYAFVPVTVTDTFEGTTTTLGTIAAPAAATAFTYAKSVANAAPGACRVYSNTATIAGGASAEQAVTVCNTLTGARTIGFWQNKNGQGIITAGAATAGICNSATFLRGFLPFADLAANATCKTVATYATSIIKAANASGASMNAMLKAQMLASALDVYFSSPASGNPLAAPVSIGGVRFTVNPAAFNGASALTGLEMLQWQNAVSNAGGSLWYGNVKATQELAKNAFDAINNEVAPIAN